jgi:hypothetical protein
VLEQDRALDAQRFRDTPENEPGQLFFSETPGLL